VSPKQKRFDRVDMVDEYDLGDIYSWVNDPSLVGYCVTWVRGLDISDIFDRLDAEFDPHVSQTWGELTISARAKQKRGIRVAQLNGWSAIIELESARGANSKWLSTLSAKAEAINVLASATGMELFSHMIDGQLITRFEPSMPAHRTGSRPDGLLEAMRDAGLDPDVDDLDEVDTRVAILVLINQVFGAFIKTQTVIDEGLPAGFF
jgi:hypothetical protein